MDGFTYDSEFYRFVLKDDILWVTYKNGPVTIEIAKDLVKKRLELSKGVDHLLIVNDESLKGIDRDARSYLSSDAGVSGIKAAVLLTNNYFSQHLANFFLKITVNKPKIPAKVFANKNEAIKWLNAQR